MLALRTISMVKKLTLLTAFFGFMESIIYVFGLALVLSGEQSVLAMIVYALGFSLGLIVGIRIEDTIAIGFRSVHANIKSNNPQLVQALRDHGFGVTVFQGDGREGSRTRLDILAKRSSEKALFSLIESMEPQAFITSFEPTRFKGGFIEQLMRKSMKKDIKIHSRQTQFKGLRKFGMTVIEEIKELTKLKDKSKV